MTDEFTINEPEVAGVEQIEGFSFPLAIYRLDKNDEMISGNKLYKLRPWVDRALKEHSGLLSCGGAYSNHLHALAAAGKRFGFKTAALVVGMETGNLTYTLQDCQSMGMQLIPVTRTQYQQRYQADFALPYLQSMQDTMIWVPEGGTDEMAVQSCQAIGDQINQFVSEYPFDSLWLAVGSGGTLAGISRVLNEAITIRAVPMVKQYQPIRERLKTFLTPKQLSRIHWVENGWYRGFGKFKKKDIEKHLDLERRAGVLLDPVYTGKLLRRMEEAYQANEFSDCYPLMLHTGGLQGRRSITH